MQICLKIFQGEILIGYVIDFYIGLFGIGVKCDGKVFDRQK